MGKIRSRTKEYWKQQRTAYSFKKNRIAWVYRILNPDKIAAYQKAYYQKHKKAIAQRRARKYKESKILKNPNVLGS